MSQDRTSTSLDPRTDPVGTVRVQRDTGVWAIKSSMGDDTGKGQHVWLSPAGVVAGDTYVLHHNEVHGWEIGEARRWRTDEADRQPECGCPAPQCYCRPSA